MANEERILTDVGISIARMTRWERIAIKLALNTGKSLINVGFPLAGKRDYIEPVRDLVDGVITLVEVADDFEAGRVSGRVVSTEAQPSVGFDRFKLIKARQDVKKKKRNV